LVYTASWVGESKTEIPNQIEIENRKRGASDWKLSHVARNREIEGYASLTSVNAGDEISFFVNTAEREYTLSIFRMGYYGGFGGRPMTSPIKLRGLSQRAALPDPETGMTECEWRDPYVFRVPPDWISGIYLVKLTGLSSTAQRYIIFVVRNDGRESDLMLQSAVTTYEAYNPWGGKSLYRSNSTEKTPAVKASFNRPYDDSYGAGLFLYWELDMVAFLEKEGYDIVYSTNLDTHQGVAAHLHKGLLSVGHDEYWSWEMRQHVQGARDQGVSLGFFCANSCYWQIRLEPSPLTGDPNRTMICYKIGNYIHVSKAHRDPAAAEPSTHHLLTTRWRDPHISLPGNPEDSLIGVMFNGSDSVDADILIEDTASWVFDDTGLRRGDVLRGLVGYEADRMYGNAPAGTVRLTHSPYSQANGTTEYSDMTVYRAASGATVFATGTLQWSFGLGRISPWAPSPSRVDRAAQQITRNVLARFIGRSKAK